MINIKVKKLNEEAKMPYKASEGAAGFDVYANTFEQKGNTLIYGTGLAFEVPDGYVLKIYPRSSVYKTGLTLANSVGVLDSDYRGELKVLFNKQVWSKPYIKGERIAQIILEKLPEVCYNEVDELSVTKRDKGGFGSTGE